MSKSRFFCLYKIIRAVSAIMDQNKKRIFIAIPISQNLQKEILGWEIKYKPLFGDEVRWLSGKNLHITLVPPWYESNLGKVYAALDSISGLTFDIIFEIVRFGPDPQRPRLIWAEGEAPKTLLAIQENVRQALGRPSEKRLWKLHLTIARFKPQNFQNFRVKDFNEGVMWKETVKSFVVMQSHLSRQGAEYEVLKKYNLE